MKNIFEIERKKLKKEKNSKEKKKRREENKTKWKHKKKKKRERFWRENMEKFGWKLKFKNASFGSKFVVFDLDAWGGEKK